MQIYRKIGVMRKSLSLLLAVMMIFSVFSVAVFAAEETMPSVGTATGERLSDYNFAPGTYTVTANLVVPGAYNTVLKDVDAYTTNGDNPSGTQDSGFADVSGVTRRTAPTMGVENNATLTVAENGSMRIKVPLPNPVFTIQSISGCSNAEVTSSEKMAGNYGLKTSRISYITVDLGDAALYNWTEKVKDLEDLDNTLSVNEVSLWGAIYTFTECSEHPAILFQDWSVPLELRVDISKIPEKEKAVWVSKTMTDDTTGITVLAESTENEGLFSGAASSERMRLKTVKRSTDGTVYDNAYAVAPYFYNQITASFAASMPWNSWTKGNGKITVTMPVHSDSSTFALIMDYGETSNTTPIEATIINGNATFELFPSSMEKEDAKTLFTALYREAMRAEKPEKYVPSFEEPNAYIAEIEKQVVLPQIAGDLIYNGKEQTAVSDTALYSVAAGEASAVNADTYKVTLELSQAALDAGYKWSGHDGDTLELEWSIRKKDLEVRYDNSKVGPGKENSYNVYLDQVNNISLQVEGFVNGETAETASGYQAPSLKAPEQLKNGDAFNMVIVEGKADNYSFTYPSTQFYVYDPCLEDPQPLDLTYNGEKQYGIEWKSEYSGWDSAHDAIVQTDVGNYVSEIGLEVTSYKRWADNTEGSKIVEWSIKPAVLTVTYTGETVNIGGKPQLELEVTGFVNGENAESAKDYVAPVLTVPDTLKPGESYTLTPSGGLARNYTFVYVPGILQMEAMKADKPVAHEGLIYNGMMQTGITEGNAYTISGTAEASDAGNYTATATLKEGYKWSDGTNNPITISWSIEKAELTAKYVDETIAYDGIPACNVEVSGFVNGETAETAAGYQAPTVDANKIEAGKTYQLTPSGGTADNYTFKYVSGNLSVESAPPAELRPGTYRITANLYVPAELNKVLGVNAYLTNPNNPLGIGGYDGVPTTPVSDNATMIIGKDGTRTIILDVVNPVFTLQQIKDGINVKVAAVVRDNEVYSGNTGVSRTGRITKLYATLNDESGLYQFTDCVEFPTLLEEDWTVPLRLEADFASAVRVSDSTEADLPKQPTDPSDQNKPTNPNEPTKPADSNNPDGSKTDHSNQNGSDKPSGSDRNDTETTNKTQTITTTHLKAGTYTVSCNIWFLKEDSGLPMNPHITSSVFPPKDPVENNATMIVDETGRALVTIPIAIQSKVMNIETITGLNIVDSQRNADGYYTSITVDLGILENPGDTITKRCQIDLKMGDLAMSISGFERDQSWPATFCLDLTNIPTVQITKTVSTNNPQTGDSTNITILLALACISLGGVVFCTIRRKKSTV